MTTPPLNPGTINDLSQAVASVEDWRAMGLFLIFVMLAQMAGGAWQRYQDRKALDKLGASLERLADQITASANQGLLHQARVEAIMSRIDG